MQLLSKVNNQNITLEHPNINSEGSDLAPSFFNDELVFGSVRKADGTKHLSYDLYSTKPQIEKELNGEHLNFGNVLPFSSDLNTALNEAIITFSPDYSEAYFTRNSQEKAEDERFPLRRLEILVALQNSKGEWSTPRPLSINSPNYSTAHPALSPDGNRLFFTSDRPGGFGGKDIYVCERIDQVWGVPVNLGPSINTEGDELYPFYHSGGDLYFASDGHIGLGGQDIFKVKELNNGWDKVINLGAPINSIDDDFGLILHKNGVYGFLTSNREGGKGGDDIYAFRPRRILLELNLVDKNGAAISNMVALMEKNAAHPLLTNENGKLVIYLTPDECKYLSVVDENFYPFAAEICASDAQNDDKLEIYWTLQKKDDINNNFVATKGQSILHGMVFDQLSGKALANAQIKLQSSDCDYSLELTTDMEGSFIYQWEKDCCFTIMVSKEGYFSRPYASDVCIKQEGSMKDIEIYLAPYKQSKQENLTVNTTTTISENGFALGSSVYNDGASTVSYRLNIYYDSGRASVREEGVKELNRLKVLMKNNESLLVEICSHTDAKGSAAANWKLSQRRADAIVNYLIKRGIAGNRLIARGYGEERLINECNDSADCTEKAHQMNRRTEFRVVDERIGQAD